MPTLHIDADSMVYAVGFACQDRETGLVAPLPNVLHSTKLKVTRVLNAFPEYGHQLHLTSSEDCFRREMYPDYKANRVQDKPLLYHVIRNYLTEVWGAVVHSRIEADDAVAVAITEDPESVIVSDDKDLLTVPGKHIRPKLLEEGLFEVGEMEAAYNFYTQLLTGDVTDNVPGVKELPPAIKEKYGIGKRKGVGPVTASKILEGAENEIEMFTRVRECYEDDSRLLLMGRLLHMVRELKDGEPVMWEFPCK